MKREWRGAFWGIAAVLVLYIGFVCMVKDHGFAMVGVAAAAALVSGGALELFTRFALDGFYR